MERCLNAVWVKGVRLILLIHMVAFPMAGNIQAQNEVANMSDSIDYNSGLIWDYNFAYYLKAANGWKMDDSLAYSEGWSAAFYPESLTAATSPVVVFPLVWFKEDTNMTVHQAITLYSQIFEADYPGSTIACGPDMIVRMGDTAHIREFANDDVKAYQKIAFIDVPNGIIAIFLSSRSRQSFDCAVDGFYEIVGSYIFLTDKVEVRYGTDSSRNR